MSTNNTVPFNWDSENDNALFGSLFPDGLSMPNFGDSIFENNSSFSKKRNTLSYSPLSKNGNDVRDNLFGNSKLYKYNNFEVVVDPSSGINPPDKIKPIEGYFYWDTNNNDKFGDTINGVKDKYAFTVKLFISKIAVEIEELHNDKTIEPAPKEILLFLEDNSDDWSSATVYVKRGSDLKDLKFIEYTMANNPRFTNFIQKENNISLADLKELLLKDKVENVGLDVISALFNINSFFVTEPFLLKGVAIAIESVVKKIKDTCLFEEKHWNPQKKEANTKFEPVLFPGSNGALDSVKDEEINAVAAKMIASFEKKFKHYDAKILGILNSDMGVVNVPVFLPPVLFIKKIDVIPEQFEQLLYQKYNRLREHAYQILEQVKAYDFSSILKKSVNMLNSFLCGIWNGFVEAVCGIISLIQYLFQGAEFMSDLMKNFKEKGPVLLEKIDDCILAFGKLDFGKIFANLASNVIEWANSESTTTLEEIAYYSGMFIGFVIELAVEIVGGILLTGGVLTVEAILTKIGQTFQALGKLVLGVMKLPISLAGKTLTGFAQALHWLYEFLSKGTDELIRIIDEVFVKLRKTIVDARKLDWMSPGLFKFGNDGATFRNFIRLQNRADDGWYNILCHGEPKRVIIDGKKLKPEELAKLLLEQGYVKGNKIRLIACETGSSPNGFAAQLSKIMEAQVIAPTKRISIDDAGEFIHEVKGKFVQFNK